MDEVCRFIEDRFRGTSKQYAKQTDIEKSILAAIQISIDFFALAKEKEELKNRINEDSAKLLSIIDSKIELLAQSPAAQ